MRRCRPARGRPTTLTFNAPQFDAAGKQTKGIIITVLFNGVKVQDAVETKTVTGGAGQAGQDGPGTAAISRRPRGFRNIWLEEK